MHFWAACWGLVALFIQTPSTSMECLIKLFLSPSLFLLKYKTWEQVIHISFALQKNQFEKDSFWDIAQIEGGSCPVPNFLFWEPKTIISYLAQKLKQYMITCPKLNPEVPWRLKTQILVRLDLIIMSTSCLVVAAEFKGTLRLNFRRRLNIPQSHPKEEQ